MNKTHRLIWNEARQGWIVTHEAAATRGKPSSTRKRMVSAVAGALMAQSAMAIAAGPAPNALPTGGQVVAGQAAISQAGNAMTVLQASDKAILNWQSFNIGSQASVNFQQPSASAVALNRVLGADPSAIYGSLTANGQVFLINPNGVLFGQGARVDVGGLVASTLNIRNEDFLSGNLRFTRDGTAASVINQGDIAAGYVAMMAPEVKNEGIIAASMGTVALAAGEAVTLGITSDNRISVQVDPATINTLIENKHLIKADEGTIILAARSAKQLLSSVVNAGSIEARGLVNDGGTIRLTASSAIEHSGSIRADAGASGNGGNVILLADLSNPDSRTTVSGSISAKGGSVAGDGGFIETSGTHLGIADSASINTSAVHGRTGQWLLDPYDFTVATVGGDITGATLSAALNLSDVTIQTLDTGASCTGATCSAGTDKGPSDGGDIFVNDSLIWGNSHTLTLSAWRSVYLNAPIDATNAGGGTGTSTGKLELQFGQNGPGFFGAGIYFVNAPVTLAAGQNFTTVFGNASDGFFPPVVDNYTVVTDKAGLQGMTAGNNDTVRYALGKNIDAAGGWTPVGTVGNTFNGLFEGLGNVVRNVTIANTANQQYVGLFGATGSMALVQNLGVVNANVAGLARVGALAGENAGVLRNVYATGTVTGSDVEIFPSSTSDDNVYAIGGLVGINSGSGLISRAHTNVTVSAVSGNQDTGGATNGGIGGLVGVNENVIDNSSTYGSVTGVRSVGGVVGAANNAFIYQSYAAGTVTGTTNVGGVLGEMFNQTFGQPRLGSTYWISDDVGTASASDGFNPSVRLSTVAAKQQASWTGFDFNTEKIWLIREGVSSPLLTAMLQPIFVYADNTTATYSGLAVTSAGATVASGTATGSDYSGAASAPTTTATNAGTYTLAPSLTLTNPTSQLGYRVESVNGTLTIDKRTLTLTAAKTFDNTNTLGTGTVTLGNRAGTETLDYSGATANSSQVGDNATNYVSAITLVNGTGNKDNYQLPSLTAQAPGVNTVTINPATLTITGNLTGTVSKVYDGNDTVTNLTPANYFLTGWAPSSGDGATVNKTTGTYTDGPNAGAATNRPVSVTLVPIDFAPVNGTTILSNYTLPTSLSGNIGEISKRTVSLAASKTYDGSTSITTSQLTVATGVGTETLNFTIGGAGTLTASSKDVSANGSNYISTGMLTLDNGANGGLAANYQLPSFSALSAENAVTLTAKNLQLMAVLGSTRTYDGSSVYSNLLTLLPGGVSSGTGAATVGDGKLYSGDVVNFVGSGSTTIVSSTVATLVGGTFDSANAGARTLTFADLALGGAQAGNYTLNMSVPTTIAPRPVTLSATKTYDGTTALANTNVTIDTGIPGQALTATGATANSKHVGMGNFINAITLDNGVGGLATNYQLPTLNAANAPVTLTAKTLTPTLSNTGVTKVYDGSTDAPTGSTPTYTFAGLVSGDASAALSNTAAAYNNKNVALASTVDVSGLAITGITGSNGSAATDYVLDATTKSVAATITPKTVSLTATKDTYDGDVNLTGAQVTIATGVAGETLTYTGATTNSKNVADNLTNYVKTITLGDQAGANTTSGGLATNYQLPTLTARANGVNTASITNKKTLKIEPSEDPAGLINPDVSHASLVSGKLTKYYDGLVSAGTTSRFSFKESSTTGSGTADNGGKYGADSVSIPSVSATVTYDDANVANATKVTLPVTISGADASNYQLDASLPAQILPRPITLTANNQTKTAGTSLTLGTTEFAKTAGTYAGSETATGVTLTSANGHATNTATAAGTYVGEIVASAATGAGGFNAGNYAITFVNGNLVIDAATIAAIGRLIFDKYPTLATTARVFNIQPVVKFLKADGTVDTGSVGTVTLTLTVVRTLTPGSDRLFGTTALAAVAGTATFTGLDIGTPGSFVLTAAAEGYTSATSSIVVQQPVTATKLAFSGPPPTLIPVNTSFVVTVQAQDANGQVNPDQTGVVTLTSTSSGFNSSGPLSLTFSEGKATFNNLSFGTPSSAVTITANSGMLGIGSSGITVIGVSSQAEKTITTVTSSTTKTDGTKGPNDTSDVAPTEAKDVAPTEAKKEAIPSSNISSFANNNAPRGDINPPQEQSVGETPREQAQAGMTLPDQQTANGTRPTRPSGPPSNAIERAPRVTASRGDVVKLSVTVPAGVKLKVLVKRNAGPYNNISPAGDVTASADGTVTLPAVQFDRSGTYTFALQGDDGNTYFVKVVV